ncbi:unnamed protein product [Diplocarpon coronariae]
MKSVVHNHSEAVPVLPYTLSGLPLLHTFLDLQLSRGRGTNVPPNNMTYPKKHGVQQDLPRSQRGKFKKIGNRSRSPSEPGLRKALQSPGQLLFPTQAVPCDFPRLHSSRDKALKQASRLPRRLHTPTPTPTPTPPASTPGEGRYLGRVQVAGCWKVTDASHQRPRTLWVREVEACPLDNSSSSSSSRGLVVEQKVRFLF